MKNAERFSTRPALVSCVEPAEEDLQSPGRWRLCANDNIFAKMTLSMRRGEGFHRNDCDSFLARERT